MDLLFGASLFAVALALLLAGIFLRLFFLSEPYEEWVMWQKKKRVTRKNK